MKRSIRIAGFIVKLMIANVLAFLMKLFVPRMRNIWIVSERGIDARDNGYFFYKYVVENHPEQKIWYIIDSSSADFPIVKKTGKWVEYGSFRHYLFYALAKVRISSSLWGGDLPCADYFKKLKKYVGRDKKFVFLKHGIIKDYLPQHCYGEGYPDIYVCGAMPEYNYVKDNFGYPEGVVKYLGLARFDNLHNVETKNQILFMPTFRKWLSGISDDEFLKSEYYNAWQSAINDPNLIKLLKEHNLELVFYPHIMLQKKVHLFSSCSERITVARFRDYDVQTLLKESKLLVTDFSSVFFDFAYMEKPVIYYQFDSGRYINEHYDFTKGYFSYENTGFGEVVADVDTLVKLIEQYVDNDVQIAEAYKKRIEDFFPLKDQRNSERIYKEIIGLH